MKPSRLILSGLLLTTVSLTGCGGVSPIVLQVTNEMSVDLKVGDTYQITYELTGSKSNVLFINDNSGVITVNETGLVTALLEGQASVRVFVEGKEDVSKTITFNVTKQREPQTYGFYTLKDGVTDLSILEGYPWINTSVDGAIRSIEKPSEKDDFFANRNYEKLQDVSVPKGKKRAGGVIYENTDLMNVRLPELVSGEGSVLAKIKSSYITGAKAKVAADIESISSMNEASLKALFASKSFFHEQIGQMVIAKYDDGSPRLDFYVEVEDSPLFIYAVYASLLDQATGFKTGLKYYAQAEGFDSAGMENRIDRVCDKLVQIYYNTCNVNLPYTKTTVGNLDTLFTGLFDVESAVNAIGYEDTDEIWYDPLLVRVLQVIENEGINFVKDMVIVSKVAANVTKIGMANYLKLYQEKLSKLSFFYNKEIDETTTVDELAVIIMKNKFIEYMTKAYADRYVTQAARQKITRLITDVIAEYRNLLLNNDWLSQTTINKAVEKLDNMEYVPFFEDGLLNLANFTSEGTDIISISNDYMDYVYTDVVDSGINTTYMKMMSIYTVNAMYVPNYNAFVITHGIVASYIDDPEKTAESLYGSIGVVIGHEISHGFDSSGSQYDKDGAWTDWWTPEDKAKFRNKIEKMVDFYDEEIRAFNDQQLNGTNLNGEVTADMGGLKVATLLGEKIEGFDFAKMYSAFAEFFGWIYTREEAYGARNADVHPLSYLRVNVTAAQFDKFQETFGIEEGDGMYIAPEDRIAIW